MAHNEAGEEGLKGFVMSFGSGDILVVKSSDKVEVGDANAFMNQSLLLMVKQDLKIRGQFEGILGLGRPHRGDNASKMVPGFMKLAGIERFSMCFNDEGPGVLGLNEPRIKESLQSVGTVHWGLDFRGIAVGENAEPLSFCQVAAPCLSIQIIVGGRQEAVHLHLADGPMATSWLRRLEVAMEVTKFTQTYLPLSMLSKTLEAWQLCNASSCAMADSQRQQDWSDLCSYVRTCAVQAWLMRRVSCRLNGFLHRICRLSDRRGASVVLASLGALHLARMRLWQRRVLQAFRALQRKEKGLSALQLCRWERDFMKSLLHCWFRAVEHNPVQGEDAVRRSRHLSWEIPLAAAAFHAWFRASAAAVLDRKQADLDVQLEKNVALLEDCQEVPVEMALRRM